MKKNFLFFLIGIIGIYACNFDKNKKVVNPSDYAAYLKNSNNNKTLESNKAEIAFWESELQRDTESAGFRNFLASLYASRFKIAGNVADLHLSDKLIKEANEKLADSKPGVYFALCQNAITQHRFQDASKYIEKAIEIDGESATANLLRFDVLAELGKTEAAYDNLKSLKKKDSFDYLVRFSKYKDLTGNLDSAVIYMEKAYNKIKDNNNTTTHTWALANLADMYGHAGRVAESYQTYLKVLEIDSNYYYALKGIAWIAFSNDKNTSEAKKIIKFIQSKITAPDLNLLLAEIAEFEGNTTEKENLIRAFKVEISKPEYGAMYNKYLVLLETEEFKNYAKALEIAQKEVANRPTGQSYDLLSWVYFNKGAYKKAAEIARKYVENQSSEPEILYHLGIIFKSVGEKEKAKKYLKEAYQSSFELGPIITSKIRKALEKI